MHSGGQNLKLGPSSSQKLRERQNKKLTECIKLEICWIYILNHPVLIVVSFKCQYIGMLYLTYFSFCVLYIKIYWYPGEAIFNHSSLKDLISYTTVFFYDINARYCYYYCIFVYYLYLHNLGHSDMISPIILLIKLVPIGQL